MPDFPAYRLETENQRLRAEIARLEEEVARSRNYERELRFLKARRQSHLANTPLAVITWDVDFRVVEWNAAAERIFGYTEEEAIGQHGCDLIVSSEVRPHVEQVFAGLLGQTGGTRSTNFNVTKDGKLITCQWYNASVMDDEGQIVGVTSLAQDVTEQEDTARALAQSEGLLRSIVENAPDVILLINREARITYINRVEPGYTRQQVLGQSAYDFVCEEDLPIIRGAVERVFATGQPEEYEVRDAVNRRWFHTRLASIVEDGRVDSAVVISLDIHERRQQEQALRESEDQLRMVTSQIPAVLWTTDRDLRFTSSIGAGLAHLDLKQDQVVGTTLQEFFHSDDANYPPLAAAYRALDGKATNYVHEFGQRWYQVHTEALRDREGAIIGTIGVALDVTDERRAEKEREESKKTFEIMARNVPGVVYLCANDERYSMKFLNDGVQKLLGIPADEFLEDRISFVNLYHPDDASVIPPAVDLAIERRDPYHLVYRLKHADGHWIWVEEYGQGVFDQNDQLQYLVGTIFDITAKREAQELLQRSNVELEKLVELRTQELSTANQLLREDYKRQLDLIHQIQASEAKFRHVCENNPGPVAITGASDGAFLYINQRFAELVRLDRSQFAGRTAFEFYEDRGQRQQLLDEIEREGEVRDFELQLRRPDGSTLWVIASMRRIKFEGEDAILAIKLDITDRKLAAKQLERQMRMLRRMLYVHDRDRQLIAYEIHDGIVQYMTGITMHLQAAAVKLDRDPQAARADLELSARVLGETIDEARRLIDGLRPGVLEEDGVAAAVKYLCDQTWELHGIKTRCDLDIQFHRLAPAVEIAIYRIVQEGLNNIVKHSQAKSARVVLSQQEETLVIKIRDQGVGFDPRHVSSQRYGLTGIRDRARLLGGEAKIKSAPGTGTRLRVVLPLEDVLMPEQWEPAALLPGEDDSGSDWQSDSSTSTYS